MFLLLLMLLDYFNYLITHNVTFYAHRLACFISLLHQSQILRRTV